VVPDLELLAKKYIEHDYGFFLAFTGRGYKDACIADLFLANFYPDKNRAPIRSFLGKLYDKSTRWHMWHYDFESLTSLLKDCGFVDIKRRKYCEGNVPDIEFLDGKPDVSLFVEAMKPFEELKATNVDEGKRTTFYSRSCNNELYHGKVNFE
jgi:hypothetical protein